MAYIGNDPSNRFVAPKAASVFSGDGSTTAFTLDHAVGSDEDILVSVDGVIQEPSVAYAVSNGTTLTFTAAPSSNSGNNIFVYYLFRTVGTVSHPSNNALTATTGTFSGAFTSPGIDDNADATAITITSDENVGVGTTSPTNFGGTNLHVNHATTYASALWTSNARSMQVLCSDANSVQSMGTRSNHPLDITTNDNAKIKITANGEVTMPSQPCFLVGKSSSATQNNIAVDTNVTVTFDTETIDANADFASNTFTAPVTGKYFLTTSLRINGDSAANYYYAQIVASNRSIGSIFDPDFGQDFVYWTITVSTVMDMDAGDTAYVHIHQAGGSQQADINNSETWTYFSGYLIA